jgi:hypothetical protein
VCIEGKGCVKKPEPVCCKAMTAQCLSCAAGVSVIDYCRKNPGTNGCPIIEPMCALIRCKAGTVCIEGKGCVKKPPVCCRAMTAQCLSCSAGVSIDEYCKENPRTAGCKTAATPPRPCPMMAMLRCPGDAPPVCGEPTVLFPGCTLPSCKCPVRPVPGGKCAKGTPDYTSTIEHCGKPFTDMMCKCTEGLWMCAALQPPQPCSTTPPTPRNECQRAQRGSKCRTCKGSNACTCQDDQATLGHELTCMAAKKPEPVCCEAMNAQCLSCSAGVSIEEYCKANPGTNGCPSIEPGCALMRCEAGTVCIEGKGCVKKPEPVCCKAMTAQCLSCAAGVSIDEYCRKSPGTAGCKADHPVTTAPPVKPLADKKPAYCAKRLTDAKATAKLCKRSNFQKNCQASCSTKPSPTPPPTCADKKPNVCIKRLSNDKATARLCKRANFQENCQASCSLC